MKTQIVSFAGQFLAIGYDHVDAENLINLLFCDLTNKNRVVPKTTIEIRITEGDKGMALYSGNRRCYSGDSLHALADSLINEAIYELIRENRQRHMLHAAALSFEGKGILIPGQSGAGKSTTAALLTCHGFNYLTDELVSISSEPFQIHPFTRPISLKRPALNAFVRTDQN